MAANDYRGLVLVSGVYRRVPDGQYLEVADGVLAANANANADLKLAGKGSGVIAPQADLVFDSSASHTLKIADNNSARALTIVSGDAAAGNSGNVTVDVGTASGTVGVLNLGNNNALAITLGGINTTTTVAGKLDADGGIDRSSASTLTLAGMTATHVVIGGAASSLIDIGGSGVIIGKTGTTVEILGNLKVDGAETFVGGTAFEDVVLFEEPVTLGDVPATGNITLYEFVAGGYVRVTSGAHGLSNGNTATIGGSGSNYAGGYVISGVTPNTFNIISTFATGATTAYEGASGGLIKVTAAAHGMENGNTVSITGVATYNGSYVISGVTAGSFKITKATPAITTFASSGGGSTTTATTATAHGLSNGDTVVITSNTGAYDGSYLIANVTTFTFTFTFSFLNDDAPGTQYVQTAGTWTEAAGGAWSKGAYDPDYLEFAYAGGMPHGVLGSAGNPDVWMMSGMAHTFGVWNSAAGAGGALTVVAGAGQGAGAGGNLGVSAGAGGVTGAGGTLALTSGAGGGTSGASGTVTLASGATAGSGNSGTTTIGTGNATAGNSGNINVLPGTAGGGGSRGGINLGASGITTTVTGALTQLTGAFSLTGNDASQISTTSTKALTITAGAASTWKTGSGVLTIQGFAGIDFQSGAGGGTTALSINSNSTAITVAAGAVLGCTGTGKINLPNNTGPSSVFFQIGGTAVSSAAITAANFDSLFNGSTISIHNHAAAAATEITVTVTTAESIGKGMVVAMADAAGAPNAYKAVMEALSTKADAIGLAPTALAAGAGKSVVVSGEVTTDDTSWESVPVAADVGKLVYASAGTSTHYGKLTLTAPVTTGNVVQKIGVVTSSGGAADTTRVVVQIGDSVTL